MQVAGSRGMSSLQLQACILSVSAGLRLGDRRVTTHVSLVTSRHHTRFIHILLTLSTRGSVGHVFVTSPFSCFRVMSQRISPLPA